MGMYSDLTAEELDEEIAILRQARRDILGPEKISKIAGEGRSIEYSRGDMKTLERSLRDALAERARRSGGGSGGAIPVEFDS
jgi:hypothetical protein